MELAREVMVLCENPQVNDTDARRAVYDSRRMNLRCFARGLVPCALNLQRIFTCADWDATPIRASGISDRTHWNHTRIEGRDMRRKGKKGIQVFLGPETRLEGKLVFDGAVRLDGHFTGNIESKEGTMIVGERGVIHADILVHTATVSGEVRGNIRATSRIELHPPARVFGDLSAPVVVIDAGAAFQGNCTMKSV